MYIILYILLSLNMIQGTIAYSRGDQLGTQHAAQFFIVCLMALALTWLAGRER